MNVIPWKVLIYNNITESIPIQSGQKMSFEIIVSHMSTFNSRFIVVGR